VIDGRLRHRLRLDSWTSAYSFAQILPCSGVTFGANAKKIVKIMDLALKTGGPVMA